MKLMLTRHASITDDPVTALIMRLVGDRYRKIHSGGFTNTDGLWLTTTRMFSFEERAKLITLSKNKTPRLKAAEAVTPVVMWYAL